MRRNLLRLAGYQAVVLGQPGLLPAEGVPASPAACLYEALAVTTVLGAGLDASGLGVRRRETAPDYLVYLLALLARVGFVHMRDGEARSVFLGYLAVALEREGVGSLEVALLPRAVRRELVGLVGGLEGSGVGAGAGLCGGVRDAVVRAGVAVYYLGDALAVFSRLTPPRRRPWPRPTSTTSLASSRPLGIRSG